MFEDDDRNIHDREEYQLPMYLPSRFRNWCHLYAWMLKVKADHHWVELPKRLHVMENGELSWDDQAVYVQTFKVSKVKQLAFDELWAALPTKEQADMVTMYCSRVQDYAPQYFEWLRNLFTYLPTDKQ